MGSLLQSRNEIDSQPREMKKATNATFCRLFGSPCEYNAKLKGISRIGFESLRGLLPSGGLEGSLFANRPLRQTVRRSIYPIDEDGESVDDHLLRLSSSKSASAYACAPVHSGPRPAE
jgi:hypothetical protein